VKLLFASNNAKKLLELEALVAGLGLDVVSPHMLGLSLDVLEDGDTFRANAQKKADAFSRASGLFALADDSGLCVDALDGRPGVLSARYAPGTDEDRWRQLLLDLENVPEEGRGAHFACVLCLSGPGSPSVFEEGRCDGRIARSPSGAGGFGYDPVFFLPALGKTMAELPAGEKNRLSHRAQAFGRMRPHLVALASLR
jgi:XTP/dITP diphosphohydrolase